MMEIATHAPPMSVLIVEDSWIVLRGLESLLGDLGVAIMGCAGNLPDALRLAQTLTPTFALVDLNLRGQMADSVVDCLIERQVPVILSSGYAREGLPARFAQIPLCCKPYDANDLMNLIGSAVKHPVWPGVH
jgi:CheY-like chemotaxis protein